MSAHFDLPSWARRLTSQRGDLADRTVARPFDGMRIDSVPDPVRIVLAGRQIASSLAALRVRQPDTGPLYYLPVRHIDMNTLHPSERQAECDWGGRIAYFHLIGPSGLIPDAVLFHPKPPSAAEELRGKLAFFVQSVDEIWVGDTRLSVTPMPRP